MDLGILSCLVIVAAIHTEDRSLGMSRRCSNRVVGNKGARVVVLKLAQQRRIEWMSISSILCQQNISSGRRESALLKEQIGSRCRRCRVPLCHVHTVDIAFHTQRKTTTGAHIWEHHNSIRLIVRVSRSIVCRSSICSGILYMVFHADPSIGLQHNSTIDQGLTRIGSIACPSYRPRISLRLS